MKALLSTTYFGPVQWYQKLYRSDEAIIEACENFQKQTFRNRCIIATTQGVQALTIPVTRGNDSTIRDVRISDHGNWRHLHWNALQSAYGEESFSVLPRRHKTILRKAMGLFVRFQRGNKG